MYDARSTPGNKALSGVSPDAVIASINTVASGVRVMLVNDAAINDITVAGDNSEDVAGLSIELRPSKIEFAKIAPFAKRGKITPPGNLPAEARVIATNLARPT